MKVPDDYIAIDCNFYDVLLENATLKTKVEISYKDEKQNIINVMDRIVDVYTESKNEYMRLENGTIVRLDYIISVGNYKISDFKSCSI